MKKIIPYLIIIFTSLLLVTCSKNSSNNNNKSDSIPQCDSAGLITSPLDVSWVQKVISGRDCQYIYFGAQMSTGIYNNRIVVYFENPASSLGACVGKVYNCNGTILLNGMSGSEWSSFDQNIQNKKVFWVKPK